LIRFILIVAADCNCIDPFTGRVFLNYYQEK